MSGRYSRRGGSNSRYTSRSRGGAAGRGAPRFTAPQGLFADGFWHCNCSPRLPAEHFKVKKEGKNQGRWFYTCQNTQDKRCAFFLWNEDAKVREEGAVLNNSRTEPQSKRQQGAQDGWDAGRNRRGGGGMFAGIVPGTTASRGGKSRREEEDEETEDESPTPPSTTKRQTDNGLKRNAGTAGFSKDQDDADELLPWALTGQEEDELSKAAEAVAAPETPRKALKTGVYATPAATTEKKRKIPWLDEPSAAPATPATPTVPSRHQKDFFATPSKPASKTVPPLPELTNPTTPSLQPQTAAAAATSPIPPTRHKDALFNPADCSSSLTSEVLATLSSTVVLPDTMSALRSLLSKHDLKTQGIVKGRDITRLALKAKDARIAELQARIASLEAERELERSVIQTLNWEKEHGMEEGGANV